MGSGPGLKGEYIGISERPFYLGSGMRSNVQQGNLPLFRTVHYRLLIEQILSSYCNGPEHPYPWPMGFSTDHSQPEIFSEILIRSLRDFFRPAVILRSGSTGSRAPCTATGPPSRCIRPAGFPLSAVRKLAPRDGAPTFVFTIDGNHAEGDAGIRGCCIKLHQAE